MGTGTPSMGRKTGKKNMIYCRRCGGHSYHLRKKKCASCGYGATAKLRHYTFHKKKR